MATGLYATITPLPFSELAAVQMGKAFAALLAERAAQGRAGAVLDETFAKVADYTPLPATQPNSPATNRPLSLGSGWALQCFASHGFHYHTFAGDNDLLSFRRLLLFSDQGFTAEIYPLNFTTGQASGPLERYRLNGPAMAELEFDGKLVHRFRPINGGVLFAYSMHALDVHQDDAAAQTQTHPVGEYSGTEVIEHQLQAARLP